MSTAVDTSVFLDILTADPRFGERSRDALESARTSGAVVVCEIVFAELAAAFEGDLERLQSFLADAEVSLVRSAEPTLAEAGRLWRAYRGGGGPRQRLLADFLVGAHAGLQADRLLTRDRGFYRSWFEELEVLDPTGA